jgi:hypothetical protein
MIHHATTAFWEYYQQLPAAIQQLADMNYELLKADPEHPSLLFKKVGSYRSVRVGIAYRALGIVDEDAGFQYGIGQSEIAFEWLSRRYRGTEGDRTRGYRHGMTRKITERETGSCSCSAKRCPLS